jgi:hypothetical protein
MLKAMGKFCPCDSGMISRELTVRTHFLPLSEHTMSLTSCTLQLGRSSLIWQCTPTSSDAPGFAFDIDGVLKRGEQVR